MFISVYFLSDRRSIKRIERHMEGDRKRREKRRRSNGARACQRSGSVESACHTEGALTMEQLFDLCDRFSAPPYRKMGILA